MIHIVEKQYDNGFPLPVTSQVYWCGQTRKDTDMCLHINSALAAMQKEDCEQEFCPKCAQAIREVLEKLI